MFILLLIVFVLQVSSTLACSCAGRKAKDVFCEVDWVSHAKVISKTLIPVSPGAPFNNWQYEVEHIYIYKGPYNLGCTIITPQDGATCGVGLFKEKEYLLAGRTESNGGLTISLCDHLQIAEQKGNEWYQVSPELREQLSKFKC